MRSSGVSTYESSASRLTHDGGSELLADHDDSVVNGSRLVDEEAAGIMCWAVGGVADVGGGGGDGSTEEELV